jgi:hypothetical protein
MGKFFRKKYPPIDTIPLLDNWSVRQGKYQGKPFVLRFSAEAKRLSGHPEYKHQVGIAIPFNSPNEAGFPESSEMEDLNVIEDLLSDSLEENNESLLVAVFTTGGMREFVFYTSNPEQVNNKFKQLQEKISTHQIQLMIQPDKKWYTYKNLTK